MSSSLAKIWPDEWTYTILGDQTPSGWAAKQYHRMIYTQYFSKRTDKLFDLETKKLSLPGDWQFERITETRFVHASHWVSAPVENPGVWLGCFSMGRTRDADVTKALKAMLSAPSHELSDKEKRLATLLRISFPYEVDDPPLRAYTQNFGSYPAIVLERHWSEYDKRTYEVIIDPNQDVAYVFHFFYAAPDAQFEKYWPIVKDWFKTRAPQLVDEYRPR